ncbi:hypothetical protein HYC85_027856 [Camellia sinensis]|uniref:Uncharacterized protein n=1 Tax=Camellia sinensis TaxID=4442 RepID=A0A7J7FTJ5_CAMSI|nr:hypothetical protein HYC85_027856 [Camellia sinensis]
MGIAELNRQAGLNLGLAEIFHQYSIGSKDDGWVYYLRIRRRREKIIKDTPDKDVNDDDFFWVSGNFEDHQAQIPGRSINWKKGEPDSAHLASHYSYPNLNILRAALRIKERSWTKLLNFEPTYRYSGRRKARVTDFLLEEAPEPDPTLPEIRLVPLTAEEEMAKKSRVRALLTATTRAEVPPTIETQPAVVALPSQRPSSSRPSKRARSTSTEQQLVDEVESIPQSPQPILQPEQTDRAESSNWAPKLTFNDRDIKDSNSVVAEKDHQLAFNLAKSVCLPKDMEHHLKQLNTEMKSIRFTSKSMILALQKNNITYKKVQELRKTTRQAMAEAEAKVAELEEAEKKMAEMQAETGRLADLVNSAEAEKQKAAIAMKDKYLRELVKLEKRKDTEITQLKKSAEGAEKQGYKQGYKKAEDAYVKQCDAAKELFFKCGWRAAVEKLGHDQQTEVFNPPAYFIPKSLAEYADALQQEFLEDSDSDDSSASEDIPVVSADPSLRLEPMVEDLPIEQPSDTVVPTETILATESELPLETGLQVDGDAAFDAEIEELFS